MSQKDLSLYSFEQINANQFFQKNQSKDEDLYQEQLFKSKPKSLSLSQYKGIYHDYFKQKNLPQPNIHSIKEKLKNNQFDLSLDNSKQFVYEVIFQQIQTFESVKIITVKIGGFRKKVKILIQSKKSPFHECQNCKSGCFGKVYPLKLNPDEDSFAIKCIQLNFKKPSTFQFYLQEYLFVCIFSQLGIGPKSSKLFGFDMIVWSDCIQYSMQRCQQMHQYLKQTNQLEKSFKILAQKLSIMHSLNIVHLDIKPENIMFSEITKQPVFIDFGCSKIIYQKIGQQSITQFSGTFQYSSPQMKKVFFSGKGYVDLYYNDVCALKYTEQKLVRILQLSDYSQTQNLDQKGQKPGNKVHFLHLNLHLNLNLIWFKYNMFTGNCLQLSKNLQFITQNQQFVVSVLYYLSNQKPTYQLRKTYETIQPLIIKIQQLFKTRSLRVNVKNNVRLKFTNVSELVNYLEVVYVKGSEFFLHQPPGTQSDNQIRLRTYFDIIEGKQLDQFTNQFDQNNSLIDSPFFQIQTDFVHFYNSLHLKPNINQIKLILSSKQTSRTLSKQYYFSIFLLSIDFTKHLSITLEQKLSYCSIFQQIIGEQQKIQPTFDNGSSNESTDKLTILKKSLYFLLDYCKSQPLTEFKLLAFSSVCTQIILVYSVNVTDNLFDIQPHCTQWLQMLIKDTELPILIKFQQIYKLMQSQFFLQITDFCILNFQLMDRKTLRNFMNRIYVSYNNLTVEQRFGCDYFKWLIFSSQQIDVKLENIKQMKKKLQKDFQVSPGLKFFLLKAFEINILSRQIFSNNIRQMERIQTFQENLEVFHNRISQTNHSFHNISHVLIWKSKLFKLLVKKSLYHKAEKVLSQIQEQMNCKEISTKTFLIDKCYMNGECFIPQLVKVIESIIDKKIKIQLISADFIGDIVRILKYKVYNSIIIRHQKIENQPFYQLQLQVLQLITAKQAQLQQKYSQKNNIIYYWFETLYFFFHTTFYFKQEAISLYQKYFNLTSKMNKFVQSKFNFLYSEIIYQKCLAKDQTQFKRILVLFETKLTGKIQSIIESIYSDKQSPINSAQVQEINALKSHSNQFQIQSLISIYFKSMISMNQICCHLKSWKKGEQICIKLAQIAQKTNHFVSFFQGLDIIYNVLSVLTTKILTSYKLQHSNNQVSAKQSNTMLKATNLSINQSEQSYFKQLSWNFVFNVCLTLNKIVQKQIQLAFVHQLGQYFQALKNNFVKKTKQINSNYHHVAGVLTFYFEKFLQVKEISFRKYNGLIIFFVMVLQLKNELNPIYTRKQSKFLFKITKYLDFLKPIFKHIVLGRYHSIFHNDLKARKFSKIFLIEKSKTLNKNQKNGISKRILKSSFFPQPYRKLQIILLKKIRSYEANIFDHKNKKYY